MIFSPSIFAKKDLNNDFLFIKFLKNKPRYRKFKKNKKSFVLKKHKFKSDSFNPFKNISKEEISDILKKCFS